jgi:hypothetical protein
MTEAITKIKNKAIPRAITVAAADLAPLLKAAGLKAKVAAAVLRERAVQVLGGAHAPHAVAVLAAVAIAAAGAIAMRVLATALVVPPCKWLANTAAAH